MPVSNASILRRIFLTLGLSVLVGCSDDSSSSSGPGAPNTTRSTACLNFQDAACDHLADTCKQFTRADCDDTFQSFFCKTDTQATACAQAFSKAACGSTLPSECNNLADTEAAASLCTSFSNKYCQKAADCGASDKKSCLDSLANTIPCERAIGVLPRYDACLGDLKCVDGQVPLPDSCKGLIKVKSTLVSEPPPGFGLAGAISVEGVASF